MKSKWHRYGVVFVVLCAVIWPISYAIVVNSTPYDIATSFIKRSPKVQEELGELRQLRLSPVGYAAGLGLSDGYADLKLSAHGERGTGRIEIDLDQKANVWHIVKAILVTSDGRTVDFKE